MAFTFALFCLHEFVYSNYEVSASIYGCTPATRHSLYIYK